ncbi:MAG: YggT family protein [Alphaproteobacteria bacterium]|jgi:YggT family protein|nr:YggT family protein [Alphaproteobacteria bacterium]MDP6238708.1 YggT family protein [Alphaproteobacteria bacterium]MDP7172834.1 YggT family protein [Alphaproteobacteria bacterium]MDP7232604.1 YggT family protein [Alphaproteobacteria bacterium]MDP7487215.1 YggT family protein [Alphaproteobacteria bacterium]|tara:strand:- start:3507 stop:3794 length:288 start_codon:yes stop_codon:yes gene_type:complete
MLDLLSFVDKLIGLYIGIIVAQAILSWLMAFNVVNTRNKFVYAVGNALYVLTEPLLRRIRRFLPATGGIDFSPLIAIVGLWFLQDVIISGWLAGL